MIFLVIPVYNENPIIDKVIKEVKTTGYENIIIVDDGSDEPIFIDSEKAKVIVIRHIINRGKGAAIKTGIEAAKILGANQIVTMDGDGQHNPKDIKKLLFKVDKGYDVVLGSRLMKQKGMPFIKVIANYLGNFFTWFIYGIWVSDSQSGFRAYSKRAFSVIDTKQERYEYDSEIIREIAYHKLKFCEVPIEIRYTKYSMNKVSKQTFYNGLKTLIRMIISA